MIELFTVFLGLTTGLQTVELVVLEPIVEVELVLDGRILGTVAGEPWSLDFDLGDALAPHDLVAIGRDADGQEVERLRQWINRTPSWEDGGAEVSADETRAMSPVAVTLEPGFELPAAGEMRSWFLADGQPTTVMRIERGPAEVVILRDPAVQPELYVLADSLYEARRVFLAPTFKGTPPEAMAWSEAWMDVDPATVASPYRARVLAAAQQALREAAKLGPGTSVRFISPWAAPLSQVQTDRQLYSVSSRIPVETKGFLEITNEVTSIRSAFRLADATALAGSELHDAARRRALVLLLGAEKDDESELTPAQVRAYLRRLQVPLFVWSMVSEDSRSSPRRKAKRRSSSRRGAEEGSDWGSARDLGFNLGAERSTWVDAFDRAVGDLRRHLAAQRIVWLQGRHLPQSITLGEDARGLRLADDIGASP